MNLSKTLGQFHVWIRAFNGYLLDYFLDNNASERYFKSNESKKEQVL